MGVREPRTAIRSRRPRRGTVLRPDVLSLPGVSDGAARATRGALDHRVPDRRRARVLLAVGAVRARDRGRRPTHRLRPGLSRERSADRHRPAPRRRRGQSRDLRRARRHRRHARRLWPAGRDGLATATARAGGRGRPRAAVPVRLLRRQLRLADPPRRPFARAGAPVGHRRRSRADAARLPGRAAAGRPLRRQSAAVAAGTPGGPADARTSGGRRSRRRSTIRRYGSGITTRTANASGSRTEAPSTPSPHGPGAPA